MRPVEKVPMNRNKLKIYYNKESGVLSIEMKRVKSVDSNIQRNVVIDYDRKGDIVRINLYQFSFAAFRRARKFIRNFARSSRQPLIVR